MPEIIGIRLLGMFAGARAVDPRGKAMGSGVVLRLLQRRKFQLDLRARFTGTVPSGKRVFDRRLFRHEFQHPILGFGGAR